MITGKQVAEKAKSLLQMATIPYILGGETPRGMDCQGLVEWTLRELGMEADYRGTNDMWRNLVSVKGSIEDGVKRFGAIPVGALIFIVDHDGGEPALYQGDGAGNAWHVYVKIADRMLVHASAGNLMVTTRTFDDQIIPNGGPNAYGLINGVDYGVGDTGAGETVSAPTASRWAPRYDHLVFLYERKDDGTLRCMGDGVREIQTGLNRCGYSLNVDGEFGPLTDEAVRKFQREHNLEDDGIVGKLTWEVLIKAANAE
jgi:hypothetical protein